MLLRPADLGTTGSLASARIDSGDQISITVTGGPTTRTPAPAAPPDAAGELSS